MKKLVLFLALFASVPAFAGNHLVKGWHSCRYSGGPGLFWYQPCHVDGIHDAPNCDSAFAELRKQDCCAQYGGNPDGFHKISCEVK